MEATAPAARAVLHSIRVRWLLVLGVWGYCYRVVCAARVRGCAAETEEKS